MPSNLVIAKAMPGSEVASAKVAFGSDMPPIVSVSCTGEGVSVYAYARTLPTVSQPGRQAHRRGRGRWLEQSSGGQDDGVSCDVCRGGRRTLEMKPSIEPEP